MMDASLDYESLFGYDPTNDPFFNMDGRGDSEAIPLLPVSPSLLSINPMTVPETVTGPFVEGAAVACPIIGKKSSKSAKRNAMPTPEASNGDSHSSQGSSPLVAIQTANQVDLNLQQQLQMQSTLHALLLRIQVLEKYQNQQEMALKQQQANFEASIQSEFHTFSSQTKNFVEQLAAKIQILTPTFPQQQFSNKTQPPPGLMGPPQKPPNPKRRRISGKSSVAANEDTQSNGQAPPNPATESTQPSYLVDPQVEHDFLEKLRAHSELKRSVYMQYNNNPPKDIMTPILQAFNTLWGSFTVEQREYLKTKFPQPQSMQPPQALAQMGFHPGINMRPSQAPPGQMGPHLGGFMQPPHASPAQIGFHPRATMQPPARPPLAPMNSHQLNSEGPGGFVYSLQGTSPHSQCQGPATQPFGTQNQPFGTQNQPFGTQNQPFGTLNQPFGTLNQPFGTPNQPFGTPNQPFGTLNQSLSPLTVPPSPHINTCSPGFPVSAQNTPQQMVPASPQIFTYGPGFPVSGQNTPQQMQSPQILMQTKNMYPQQVPHQQNFQVFASSPSNPPSQWQQIDPTLGLMCSVTASTNQQLLNGFESSPPNQIAQPYTPQASHCATSAPLTPQGYASTPSTPQEYSKVPGAPSTAPKPSRRAKRKAAEKDSQ